MARTSFLAGISAIALAAGANAQTTTTNGDTTDPNTGNRRVVSCTAGSSNSCSVTQQAGTTFSSTGSANATGSTNTSTITQTGNRQFAESRATGDRNSAAVTQNAFNNSSSISQTGTAGTGLTSGNVALVQQGSGNGTGNNNTSQIVQVRTAGAADTAGFNRARTFQGTQSGGFNNLAVQTQNGTFLESTVNQFDANATGIGSVNNSATVLQISAGASSTVNQYASGNVASVSMFGGSRAANSLGTTGANVSAVTQNNTLFQTGTAATSFAAGAPTSAANSPTAGNVANVGITGLQNNSTVSQNGVQNTVDQSILNGGAGNTSAAGAMGTNPGTGAAFPTDRPEGNSSSITQTGRGNYAATSIGGRVTTGGGSGNISTITQNSLSGTVVNGAATTATAADAGITQTTLTSAMTATSGHRALVYQRGILDRLTITQSNNNLGSGTPGTTLQSGSVADVAQLSFNSSATVQQVGSNNALVTQGSRTEPTGADNQVFVDQTDAGDIVASTTTPGTGGGFGGTGSSTNTSVTTSRNNAEVVQYGIQNLAAVQQNAINARATIFQAVGTRSYTAGIYQGNGQSFVFDSNAQSSASSAAANRGANAQNLTASISQTSGNPGANFGAGISQNGRNLTAVVTQAGGTAAAGTATNTASGNIILLSQANDYSSATVSQNGLGLSATVEQRGVGTAARPNLVTITQTGGGSTATTTNSARAVQTESVGASGATGATAGVINDVNFPFSRAGANSAEIVILQSGTGGSATVEQRGKGQFASITQTGTNNVGGILQDTGATNAVAVLTQSGTGNTYYITQTVAGQYIRVNQSGTDNTASIINGPSGAGNNGAANPQTPPQFTANANNL